MKLVGCNLQQHQVAGTALPPSRPAKKAAELAGDFCSMVTAEAVIPANGIGRDLKHCEHKSDAVQADLGISPLRPETRSDQRSCALPIILRHRLCAWISSQQVCTREVRLTAEIHRVREALDARRESLVAALAQVHSASRNDLAARQVAHANFIPVDRDDDG
jgi:hypothetical protein